MTATEAPTLKKKITISGFKDYRIRLGEEGQLVAGAIIRNPFDERFELVEFNPTVNESGLRVSTLARARSHSSQPFIVRSIYSLTRESSVRYLRSEGFERITDEDLPECDRKLTEAYL